MKNNLGIPAIGWVHFQLGGGTRNTAITVGIYAVLLVGLVALVMRASDPAHAVRSIEAMARLDLGLQALVLLVFGTFRVSGSIRADVTSNMIESHRLMPVPPRIAVLGYLLGGSAQALCLFTVNLLIGVALASMAGMDLVQTLMAHLILLWFAAFVWTLAMMCALVAKQFFGLVALLFSTSLFTGAIMLMLLPGTSLLITPLTGRTIFAVPSAAHPAPSGTGSIITWATGVSFAVQAVAGAIFFTASGRRYRNPQAPLFKPGQALVLLGAWMLLSVVGIAMWDQVRSEAFSHSEEPGAHMAQFITSLLSVTLLALLPAAAAARWYAIREARWAAGEGKKPSEWAPLTVLGGAVLLVLPLTLVSERTSNWRAFTALDTQRLIVTAGMTLAVVAGLHYLLRVLYRARIGFGPVLGFAWMFLTWVLPLVVDFVGYVLSQACSPDRDQEVLGYVSSLSPIGTAIFTWSSPNRNGWPNPVPGVVVQLCFAGLMAGLYAWASRRRAAAIAE